MENQQKTLGFLESYILCFFTKYATFTGRGSRGEYWKAMIINFIISVSFNVILFSVENNHFSESKTTFVYLIYFAYTIYTIIPLLSATCRRLHDINKSGWFQFVPILLEILNIAIFGLLSMLLRGIIIVLIFIGHFAIIIWFIVLLAKKGDEGENRFGPVPDYSKK